MPHLRHLLPHRNGIYPLTAIRMSAPQQPQKEAVQSPVVTPSVKTPTPEPAELEYRKVRDRRRLNTQDVPRQPAQE